MTIEATATPEAVGSEAVADANAVTEGAGEETQTPNYGGFETLEELVEANKSSSQRVEELDSLRGRQGDELGDLRHELARLQGANEAFQTQAKPATPVVTVDDLSRMYDSDEITLGEMLSRRDALVIEQSEQNTNNLIDEKLTTFSNESNRLEYANQFVKDNPGYVEAFDAGHLREDMQKGHSAEQAWTNHQLKQANSKIAEMEDNLTKTKTEAHGKGVQDGAKLEQGKDAAGNVIGQSKGSFMQEGSPTVPLSHADQRAKGVALVSKMRGGG